MATFLHPNYKQLGCATPAQISECHRKCRASMSPANPSEDVENDEDCLDIETNYEPKSKRPKLLMTFLMDKVVDNKRCSSDEVDEYLKLQLDVDCHYINPLTFWQQPKYHLAFPTLARLAKQFFPFLVALQQ